MVLCGGLEADDFVVKSLGFGVCGVVLIEKAGALLDNAFVVREIQCAFRDYRLTRGREVIDLARRDQCDHRGHSRELSVTADDDAVDVAAGSNLPEEGDVRCSSGWIGLISGVLVQGGCHEVVLTPQLGMLKPLLHCREQLLRLELMKMKRVARWVDARVR